MPYRRELCVSGSRILKVAGQAGRTKKEQNASTTDEKIGQVREMVMSNRWAIFDELAYYLLFRISAHCSALVHTAFGAAFSTLQQQQENLRYQAHTSISIVSTIGTYDSRKSDKSRYML